MIVRPVDFAVVQQMNEVSHIKQEENQRPVVEQRRRGYDFSNQTIPFRYRKPCKYYC